MAEAAAMAKTGWKPLEFFSGGGAAELAVPVAVLAIVMALIAPLPPFLLDLLLVVDIMMSVIVMMTAMYIQRPSDFNVFPTTLLLLTLYRLALNVSSARLILLNGNTGTAAAGHVIEAFGSFVVGGNYIIGAVIFLLLIAIQYVVINHGAVRISEVTARFTLDALPGKQMSIDSDLSSGLIDESEARRRRKQLAAEAEFYGAMDGASRFTQRDAVASILITGINIIAGFLIGVLQHGMELRHALETYTVLTIGDGLVTVVPALMISVSGALVITRSGSEARLSADFRKQIFGSPQPLLLASGVLIVLACLPGMPGIPFLLLGVGLGVGAVGACGRGRPPRGRRPAPPNPPARTWKACSRSSRLAIEVGLGLVKMVEGAQNSPLLKRISGIRRQLAADLGYLLPPVRVSDNLALRAREYVISLKGAEIARYELPQGCQLAIPSGRNARGARRHAHPRAGLWIGGLVDSRPARRAGPRGRVHAGGCGQRAGHSHCGAGPAARARAVLAPGRQESAGSGGGRSAQGSRGSGAQTAPALGGPTRVAESAARAGLHPRHRLDSGGAGRGGALDAQSWCCSPSTPGRPSGARLPSAIWTLPATCRPIFWTPRSSRRWSPRCSIPSRTAT
jgi:flagellar biosynthesis component FlhA